MKIEISLLAALVLIGTDLLARATVQGFEMALVATVLEYGRNGIRRGLDGFARILTFGR